MSHTKNTEVNLLVSAEFMPAGEHVLVVDDFLATGKTIRSLLRIVKGAKSTVVGIACVVEKTFEGGRAFLHSYEVPIEALVTITSMENGQIVFAE